jgi:hypothetical protein
MIPNGYRLGGVGAPCINQEFRTITSARALPRIATRYDKLAVNFLAAVWSPQPSAIAFEADVNTPHSSCSQSIN